MRQLNLIVKFLLELAALAALAYWGAQSADGVAAVALAVGLPLAAALLWGVFAAPRASRRLPLHLRVPFELCVFALAAAALEVAASTGLAIAFAAIVVVNAALLTAFSQWEE